MNSVNLYDLKQTVAEWMESSDEEQLRIPSCVSFAFEAERRIRRASKELQKGDRF